MSIPAKRKKELGDLLAKWYRNFGKVSPRRPYLDEDEDGGEGAPSLVFEAHPLLAEQPIGASSDLTYVTADNQYSVEEAEKRSDEASPQLTRQLDYALQLGKRQEATPAPNPFNKI